MLADENIFMFLLFYFNAGRTILRVKQASSVSRRPFPCQASGNSDGKPDLEFVSLFFDCFCLADENIFMFLLFYFNAGRRILRFQAGLFRVRQASSVSSKPFPCQGGLFRVKQPEIGMVSLISNS